MKGIVFPRIWADPRRLVISGYPVVKRVWTPISFRIALGLLLVFCCAYGGYAEIREADFLTGGKKYEAQDIGNLLIDKKNLTGETPQPLSFFLFFKDNFLENFSFFSLPSVHLCSPLILRC